MKVLIDLNIALDVLLDREPWVAESKGVWQANHEKSIQGYLVATSLTNLFYIARKLVGHERARDAVRTLLDAFDIVAVDQFVLKDADSLPGNDFEDNVCMSCAKSANLDAIVTRNPSDFSHSAVPVYTPPQLLALLAAPKTAP